MNDAPLVDMSTVDVTRFDHEDEAVSAALQRILASLGSSEGAMSAFQSYVGVDDPNVMAGFSSGIS